ncbi:methionyl-tRNA synthetase [Niveomyces insectorum RCEF 264]|uniref:methionine--tRNA ligase n=1 Tax=Niveomyces insectorum RCEF 264 TaxID=1081102 RepID=A0A167MG76_9HYPO|nr:methionyl-tRNA synthetase [Niveomyces insectorum RCEF 264]
MYSMVLADVLKRWQTLRGRPALLCTGTDEHGLKVQQAAARAGVPPKQFCDENAAVFADLARRALIDATFFIRTTDPDHAAAVRAIWRRLRRRGYVYQARHQGWYCVSDETFYPENLVEKRRSPVTGKVETVAVESGQVVEWTEERNYHFRMTAVRDRLLAFYRENPDFVVPAARMAEVVDWVTHHLEDLSISRPASRLAWALPVPEDQTQTIYVWVDALANYLTKAGYPDRWAPEEAQEEAEAAAVAAAEAERDMETSTEAETTRDAVGDESAEPPRDTPSSLPARTLEQRQRQEGGGWPADVHVVGKDIVRFHAVYWPALLLALDLPLPRQILSHAHWTLGRRKMSKSVGNVVNPFYAMDRFGVDAMRYYLMHDGGIEYDGDYGNEHIVERYKKGLQGGLGNLLGRVTRTTRWNVRTAVVRVHGGVVEVEATAGGSDADVAAQVAAVRAVAGLAADHMARLDPRAALHAMMDVVYQTNKFLHDTAPWTLATQIAASSSPSPSLSPSSPSPILSADSRGAADSAGATNPDNASATRARLDRVVYLAAEALRVVGILLQAIMPEKAAEVLNVLGVGHAHRTFAHAQLNADSAYGVPLRPPGKGKYESLFPPLPVEN